MEDFKRIGLIEGQELENIKEYLSSIVLDTKPSKSTYVVGNRREIWFEKEVKLKKQVTIEDAPHNKKFYQLGQKWFPKNDSCLVLYYPPAAFIKEHRDHPATEAKVIQINIGCHVYLSVNGKRNLVKDGEILEFNSKLLHGTSQALSQRWVISWRKIKDVHLANYRYKQINLFTSYK